MKTDDQIRTDVRNHYSAVARGEARTGCCAPIDAGAAARVLGYSADEVSAAPAGATLGLGCGPPPAIAALRPGEVVVDLGSGGGFDCFLAARAVGPTGRVIGVDGSADMIARARRNAEKHAARNAASAAGDHADPAGDHANPAVDNVEFRLGEIEHLPIADATADVVISNCVVNLAPDKRAVLADVARVLKPGGRIAISDVVALRELPATVVDDLAARCGCIAGAARVDELTALLRDLGFVDVLVEVEPQSREIIAGWGGGFEDLVASARITATKPGGACCAPGCCG